MTWTGRGYFGQHLMVDGYGARRSRLSNLAFISETLEDTVSLMGMTLIAPPYVFRYTGKRPLDWGITGVALIAESHISIHTFPEHQFVTVDCYSCKMFDEKLLVEHIEKSFDIVTMNVNVVERGGVPG